MRTANTCLGLEQILVAAALVETVSLWLLSWFASAGEIHRTALSSSVFSLGETVLVHYPALLIQRYMAAPFAYLWWVIAFAIGFAEITAVLSFAWLSEDVP